MNIRRRQDAIVRLLRRNGTSTVDDLAAEIGASRRTVLRDIAALRDLGFVIHSESGRGGGLQLDPESLQTTARLSVTEVFALIISVAAMRAARSLPFSDLADAGLTKIEKTLPADRVRDLRRLLDCLYVGKLSPEQDVSTLGSADLDLLPAFETAFLQLLHLRFRYRDAKGQETVASEIPGHEIPEGRQDKHGLRLDLANRFLPFGVTIAEPEMEPLQKCRLEGGQQIEIG